MDRSIRNFGEQIRHDDRRETVLSGEEARQGETSGHMRRVLVFSLMLMLIAGAVMIAIHGY